MHLQILWQTLNSDLRDGKLQIMKTLNPYFMYTIKEEMVGNIKIEFIGKKLP